MNAFLNVDCAFVGPTPRMKSADRRLPREHEDPCWSLSVSVAEVPEQADAWSGRYVRSDLDDLEGGEAGVWYESTDRSAHSERKRVLWDTNSETYSFWR